MPELQNGFRKSGVSLSQSRPKSFVRLLLVMTTKHLTLMGLKWKDIDFAAATMRALAHPLRLSILQYIIDNKTPSVKDIYKGLDLEQSNTSQHLTILKEVDLVRADRAGRKMIYSVNTDRLGYIHGLVEKYIQEAEK